jgi:hypothetical protein
MYRPLITATVILASFACATQAQQKPNFSGTWKLNTAKSDFGVLPGPESRTDVIEQSDSNMKITVAAASAQGKLNYTLNYPTDGSEAVNKLGPREVSSTATWDGPVFVVNSKLTFNDMEVTIKARWTLSDDGKTMTQSAHLASAMGETDQKFVFDKQSGDVVTQAPPAPDKVAPKPASSTGRRPNFSGVWKLNVAKSDFSVLPPPESRTDTIEHNDPSLKFSRRETVADGPRAYVLNVMTDGTEVVNPLGPNEAKCTGTWEGSALVVVTKLKFQEQDVLMRQVSTLSDDGKTITTKNHITSPLGELDQVEIYDKQ